MRRVSLGIPALETRRSRPGPPVEEAPPRTPPGGIVAREIGRGRGAVNVPRRKSRIPKH